MIKLSILIPTLEERKSMLDKLISNLENQISFNKSPDEIEILIESDNRQVSVGGKRNKLLERAIGKYICFIDDDDDISHNYMELLLKAVESDCDCASLKGYITIDGGTPEVFEHSLKYSKWETTENEIKYLRFPNHISCIKTSIAKQIKFPEKNYGEDFDWSTELHNSGLLKTEYYIPEIIYYYNYISNK